MVDLTMLTLANIQPEPRSTNYAGNERYRLLHLAAIRIELLQPFEQFDPEAITLDLDTARRLRDAIDQRGSEGQQRTIGSHSPFNRHGYQTRWFPDFTAKSRRDLLHRTDQAIAELQTSEEARA